MPLVNLKHHDFERVKSKVIRPCEHLANTSDHLNYYMSTRKPHPSTSDKIIRFIFGIIVFSALVSGGTYYLQSSLLILQVMGLYAHWAFILILLPALSGLVQHLIDSPARLIVAVLGSLASTTILYPIYAERFWAIPPSITDTIVYTLTIAGIGFTSSINPLDRHVHQRRASGSRKKSSKKHESLLHVLKKTYHISFIVYFFQTQLQYS